MLAEQVGGFAQEKSSNHYADEQPTANSHYLYS